jgi:hypothetical protein
MRGRSAVVVVPFIGREDGGRRWIGDENWQPMSG